MHVNEQLKDNTRTINGSNPEWEGWPQAAAVKLRLQITHKQLNELITSGRLTRWSCPDGSMRFSPDQLDEQHDVMRSENEKREQAQAEERRDQELSSVLSRAVSLLKISQDHTEKLLQLVTSPIDRGTNFLLKINQQQATRIEHLEREHEEMLSTREALLSAAHERDLKARKVELTQQNFRHAIDQITGALGPIASQILGNLGIPLGKAHPGLELLQSIDPALLMSLVQLQLLTPQQLKLCKQIWPDLDWPEPEAPAASPPASGAAPASAAAPASCSPPAPAAAPASAAASAPSAAPEAPEEPDTEIRAPRRRRRSNQGDPAK